MYKKNIIIIAIFIYLFINLIFAQNYYADLEIDVNSQGLVNIFGKTDYNEFKEILNSPQFTSKDKEYWILNITTKKVFDNFIFELYLPKNSQINYIKTTPNFRIDEENNRIKLIGTGENKPITIIVQYKIENNQIILKQENNIIIYFIIFIISIISGFLINKYLHQKKEKRRKKYIKSNKLEELEYTRININILPQRQQEIIKILKEKGKITQKELENIMKIPKSSISRNIKTLEIKGIVKKENIGITNYIHLKKYKI